MQQTGPRYEGLCGRRHDGPQLMLSLGRIAESSVTASDAIADFWDTWHTEFDENDGSLPELRLVDVPPGGANAVWRVLISRARDIAPTTLWREDLGCDVPIGSGMDAGDLVSAGKVASFHTVLRGVRRAGIELPELGVFCALEEVSLDYRGGPEWDPGAFLALLGLLSDMVDVAPGSRVTPEDWAAEEYRVAFERAFAAFRVGNAA
jgi:hypothetical protein